jgi:predicted DCC family thiol-disulfide oxidoreductase YuxK
MPDAPPVLLYDGDCALCSWAVRTALRWDRRRTLEFASLHGAAAERLLRDAPPGIRTADSLIWIEPGPTPRYLIRSDGALALAHYLGGWFALAGLLRAVPRPVRDWGYDMIARKRFDWFGTSRACVLPSSEDRPRFLDLHGGESAGH